MKTHGSVVGFAFLRAATRGRSALKIARKTAPMPPDVWPADSDSDDGEPTTQSGEIDIQP